MLTVSANCHGLQSSLPSFLNASSAASSPSVGPCRIGFQAPGSTLPECPLLGFRFWIWGAYPGRPMLLSGGPKQFTFGFICAPSHRPRSANLCPRCRTTLDPKRANAHAKACTPSSSLLPCRRKSHIIRMAVARLCGKTPRKISAATINKISAFLSIARPSRQPLRSFVRRRQRLLSPFRYAQNFAGFPVFRHIPGIGRCCIVRVLKPAERV